MTTCDSFARRGTGFGRCDRPLDEHGQCDRADRHVDQLTPKTYDHDARPDDLPEPGDRCKDCGDDITWTGPTQYDWLHVDEQDWS